MLVIIIKKDSMKVNVGVNTKKGDKERCNKGFIWNPSNCNCGCDKSCDIGEYLDYKNCKCKKMINQLVEKCRENIDENEMNYNKTLND